MLPSCLVKCRAAGPGRCLQLASTAGFECERHEPDGRARPGTLRLCLLRFAPSARTAVVPASRAAAAAYEAAGACVTTMSTAVICRRGMTTTMLPRRSGPHQRRCGSWAPARTTERCGSRARRRLVELGDDWSTRLLPGCHGASRSGSCLHTVCRPSRGQPQRQHLHCICTARGARRRGRGCPGSARPRQ